MNELKLKQIQECIDSGEWGILGDSITRNDMIDYIMHHTNPDLEATKVKKVNVLCPICGHTIKPQVFGLTHRAVKYLMAAVHLSKKDIEAGGNGFTHYDDIRNFCMNKFEYEKGKRKGTGINFTSYSTLTKYPWNFLEPNIDTNDKVKRNGFFRPTTRCYEFLRAKLSVPEKINLMDGKVVGYSNKKVFVFQAKELNFKQACELFKTF